MEGKKYETDLTRKEKRQLEAEKLKTMNKSEKIEYIWTYYKLYFFAAVLVIIGLVIAFNSYQESKVKTQVSIAVIDAKGDAVDARDELEKELHTYMCGDDKFKKISLDTAMSSADSYTFNIKLDTLLGTKSLDVIICDEKTYNDLKQKEVFSDWEEVLGESYAKYEPYIIDGNLHIESSEKLKNSEVIPYTPVYLGVVRNSTKIEAAKKTVTYFLG